MLIGLKGKTTLHQPYFYYLTWLIEAKLLNQIFFYFHHSIVFVTTPLNSLLMLINVYFFDEIKCEY